MLTLPRWFTVASNVAYPLAGLLAGEPVFFLLMLGLGVASAIYHYNNERNADWDVGMIYVILLFLIGLAWGVPPHIALAPSIVGGYAIRKHVPYMDMEFKVGIFIGPMLIFGFFDAIHHWVSSGDWTGTTLLAATVILTASLAIRQWVNHGLWHLTSAGGLALVAHALLQ